MRWQIKRVASTMRRAHAGRGHDRDTGYDRAINGFTLIELMITVAIVAILSTLAYPSYRNYVLRGQLVNATNGLSVLQANMERFYQDNRTYVTVGAFTSPCLATDPVTGLPATQLTVGNFQLSCSAGPAATTYTLQAAGIGGTPVAGFVYTVNEKNVQSTTITNTSNWNTAGMACWVTKEGPQC